MAKENADSKGNETHTEGSDAGVLSDAEIFGELGISITDLDALGGESESGADGENDGEEADGEGGEESLETEGGTEEESEESDGEDAEEADEQEEEEEESDGDDEEEEKLPRSVVKLQKRVSKLTKRAKGAEERVTTLEADNARLSGELAERSRPVLAPVDADPLSDLTTETAVNERLQQMRQVRRWALQNPDGAEVAGKDGNTITVTPEQVRERLLAAEAVIEAAPARLEYLRTAATVEKAAKAIYPAMFKPESPESKIVDGFLKQCPEIMRLPNWRLIVGDALMGQALRLQSQGKKSAGKSEPGKKPVAAKTPKSPGAASVPARKVAGARTMSRFRETGSVNDLAAMIAAGEI